LVNLLVISNLYVILYIPIFVNFNYLYESWFTLTYPKSKYFLSSCYDIFYWTLNVSANNLTVIGSQCVLQSSVSVYKILNVCSYFFWIWDKN